MKFGPTDKSEEFDFALEELRAEIQYEILRGIKSSDMTQAEFADKLGVSSAWVSQILGDDANLTVESLVKVFLGLDRQCHLSVLPLDDHFRRDQVSSSLRIKDEWTLAERPADIQSLSSRDKKTPDTTAMLMRLIESNSRVAKPVQIGNDNHTERAFEQEVA